MARRDHTSVRTQRTAVSSMDLSQCAGLGPSVVTKMFTGEVVPGQGQWRRDSGAPRLPSVSCFCKMKAALKRSLLLKRPFDNTAEEKSKEDRWSLLEPREQWGVGGGDRSNGGPGMCRGAAVTPGTATGTLWMSGC